MPIKRFMPVYYDSNGTRCAATTEVTKEGNYIAFSDHTEVVRLIKGLIGELEDGGTYVGPKHASIPDPAPRIKELTQQLQKLLE